MTRSSEPSEELSFQVHVAARSRRNHVGGVYDHALKVAVTEVPEKGKANQAVILVVASALGIPAKHLRLASGATHRRKTLVVADVRADVLLQVKQRLAELKNP